MAFMDIDFNGKGYLSKADMDRCLTTLNLPYSLDQIYAAMGEESVLTKPDLKMDFHTFCHHFFWGANEVRESWEVESPADNKEDVVMERMFDIEKIIKHRFG